MRGKKVYKETRSGVSSLRLLSVKGCPISPCIQPMPMAFWDAAVTVDWRTEAWVVYRWPGWFAIHSEAGTKAVEAHRTDRGGQCERKYLQAAELGTSGSLLFLEWEKIAQNKIYSDEWTFTNVFSVWSETEQIWSEDWWRVSVKERCEEGLCSDL